MSRESPQISSFVMGQSVCVRVLEVSLMALRLGIHAHCPKFQHHKMSSFVPDAFLSIEDGAGRSEKNPSAHEGHRGQPQREREQDAVEIQDAFPVWNFAEDRIRMAVIWCGWQHNLRVSEWS